MGVSLQEDGPTFEVGCPGERLVNVALPDGVPSQARQLRDDWHLTASRHSGQEVVDISQSLSTVQAPFKRRARDAPDCPTRLSKNSHTSPTRRKQFPLMACAEPVAEAFR